MDLPVCRVLFRTLLGNYWVARSSQLDVASTAVDGAGDVCGLWVCQSAGARSSLVDGQQQAELLARQAPVRVLVEHSHRRVAVVLHVLQRHLLYIHTHT